LLCPYDADVFHTTPDDVAAWEKNVGYHLQHEKFSKYQAAIRFEG
jgi:hypothetical protein